MGLEEKDWIMLVIGTLLSVPGGVVATLILGPVVTILCGFHLIKTLAKLRQCFFHDDLCDREWKQNWCVVSDRFPLDNPSSLKIYRFLHLLAAEAEQKPLRGPSYAFRIVGVMTDGKITGKWMDPGENGYYGAFQLVLSKERSEAVGKWVGFSDEGAVKAGDWTWTPIIPPLSN